MKKYSIQKGQPDACAGAEEQQPEKIVRLDYDLEELIYLTRALASVVAVPEITGNLYVEIALVSDLGLRVCFSAAETPLGYVLVRSPGDGSIDIEADTVLQELENRSQGRFDLDSFDFAATWIRNLGVALAYLEKSWGWNQVIDAATARLKRLG